MVSIRVHLCVLVLLTWSPLATAEPAQTVDEQFATFKLASVPLPGSADEIVVDEEQSLEVFLSPSDFPDALARLTLSGVSADFAVNLDLSTLQGQALADRVQWPELGGRPLAVSAPASGITLAAARPRPRAPNGGNAEEWLAGEELRLEWYLTPEEGDTQGSLRGRVRAVRLATSDDLTLATWIAPPPPEGCAERFTPGGAPRCHVHGVSRAIQSLSIDISGRWVAIAGGDLRPRVDIWELESFTIARRIAFPPWQGSPQGATYTADGRLLVVVDGVGAVHLWNAATGGEHRQISAAAQAFTLLDAGRLIAVADGQGGVTLWRTDDGTIASRLGSASGRVSQRLTSSGDGQRLAALSFDEDQTTVMVWQIEDERLVGRVSRSGRLIDIGLDGSGEYLVATHDEEGLLRARLGPAATLAPFGGEVGRRCRGRLALSPDDRLLACTLDQGIALLDARQGRLVQTFGADDEHGRSIEAIVFTPDGARIIATGGGELLEWPLEPAERGRR